MHELGLSPGWKLRAAEYGAGASADNDGTAEKLDGGGAFRSGVQPPTGTKADAKAGARTGAEAGAEIGGGGVAVEIPVAEMDWDVLRATVLECRKCGLCRGRKQAVFGVGDIDADLFLAGEGPGRDEDRLGDPFVGRAGKLLDLMLGAIGMSRGANVYIANVVKCRPPENRNPTAEESGACMPYLDRQIALSSPRLLVALGRVAAGRLLDTNESIARLRQRLHDRAGLPLIVTYHPAYLLRNPADKRKAWEDLCFIRKVLRGREG